MFAVNQSYFASKIKDLLSSAMFHRKNQQQQQHEPLRSYSEVLIYTLEMFLKELSDQMGKFVACFCLTGSKLGHFSHFPHA